MGTMCIQSKTLCPTFKGYKWGYLVFHRNSTERDWSQKCYHSNNLESVILFFLCHTLPVQSLKNTAPIFLEKFLIFICSSDTTYDLITFLICIIQNMSISKMIRDTCIPERKPAFFVTLKNLSNKQQLFFPSQAL